MDKYTDDDLLSRNIIKSLKRECKNNKSKLQKRKKKSVNFEKQKCNWEDYRYEL